MASSQYYIRNQEGTYFLTMTVVDWVVGAALWLATGDVVMVSAPIRV